MRPFDFRGKQLELGQTRVSGIDLPQKSRDDIPAVLRGIQAVCANEETYAELHRMLEEFFSREVRLDVGRPGLPLFSILVLGALKEGANLDLDRMEHIANYDVLVRQFLGFNEMSKERLHRETVRTSMEMCTPELLQGLNQLVVKTGHKVVGKKPGDALQVRCDSFVVETDVRHPTDVSLLRDAMCCSLRLCRKIASDQDLRGWRKTACLVKKTDKLFKPVRRVRDWKSRPDELQKFLDFGRVLHLRVLDFQETVEQRPLQDQQRERLEWLAICLAVLPWQIEERVFHDRPPPHSEKIISVHEPHTRWISKGKAGRPQELGVPVSVVEDQHGFVLQHEIMWHGGDRDVAESLIENARRTHPEIDRASFDRGFYSKDIQARLSGLLRKCVIPARGRQTQEIRARESDEEFKEARRLHSAVESKIHHLESHGLDRVRTQGRGGFARTVAFAVLATNLHHLGRLAFKKDRERMRHGVGPPVRRAA